MALGLSLVSAMKRLMAAWSSTIDLKTPRLSRCRVSLAKQAFDRIEPRSRRSG